MHQMHKTQEEMQDDGGGVQGKEKAEGAMLVKQFLQHLALGFPI